MVEEIKFKEFGRVYLPIQIKPKDEIQMQPVYFKVDTGADSTTISKETLGLLGYDSGWVKRHAFDGGKSTVASGEQIDVMYVKLPLINILGYEGKNWPLSILLDEEQDGISTKRDFRNLLGRDLLAGFNYRFNNDSDCLEVERASQFKPRMKFLPEQEIHETMGRGIKLNKF